MSRMKDANWRRLLVHHLRSSGYVPLHMKRIDNDGVSLMPSDLLELRFDVNGNVFDLHVVYPGIPDRRTANDHAFRLATVLALYSGGQALPATVEYVEELRARLSTAMDRRIPHLILHPTTTCVKILASHVGYDGQERRMRSDVSLDVRTDGLVDAKALAQQIARVSDATTQKARLALPMTHRYTVDPLIVRVMLDAGQTSRDLLDLVERARVRKSEMIETSLYAVEMLSGRLDLVRWNATGNPSVQKGVIRIAKQTLPQTVAIALVGERFDRLAAGTIFSDMPMLRVMANKNSISIAVDRTEIPLGEAAALLGADVTTPEWTEPGLVD